MAATARSTRVVRGEPETEVARVASVPTQGTEGRQAGARQATHGAADGDCVAVHTPPAPHRLPALRTPGRDHGGEVVAVLAAGETLEELSPRLEHLPPVQKVRVGLDVRVIELVVVRAHHAAHLKHLSGGTGAVVTVGGHLPVLQPRDVFPV